MKSEARDEFTIIAEILAPLGRDDSRSMAFVDDAAVLPQRQRRDTVVTTDTMVCGVHFLADEPPGTLARRLLRVNLSDLAAMGAAPDAYFLNLALPEDVDGSWLHGFADGLRSDQERFGVVLLGGDLTRTPGSLTMSVTATGHVPSGTAVTRSGAAAGDVVMVSGTIGDAVLGLEALRRGRTELAERFQLPEPRVALGRNLRGIASAMADVSDGLIADLGHICAASRVAATVSAASVPLSAHARERLGSGEADLAALLTGGDDYELVFCVPPDREEAAAAAARHAGVAIRRIGVVHRNGEGVSIEGADGTPFVVERTGYRHF